MIPLINFFKILPRPHQPSGRPWPWGDNKFYSSMNFVFLRFVAILFIFPFSVKNTVNERSFRFPSTVYFLFKNEYCSLGKKSLYLKRCSLSKSFFLSNISSKF